MVTGSTPGVRAPSRRHMIWAVPLLALSLLSSGIIVIANFMPSSALVTKHDCVERDQTGACTKLGPAEAVRYVETPAEAVPVEPRLETAGVKRYPATGKVYFVTIQIPNLTMLEWFVIRKNPAALVQSYQDVFGTSTPQEQEHQGLQQMIGAKDAAEYVALKRTGYPVTLQPGKIVVDRLLCLDPPNLFADEKACKTPTSAATQLQQSDILIEVDGKPVTSLNDLAPILTPHKPGDVVKVKYERDGKQATADVTVIAAPDDSKRTIIGFTPADTTQVHIPSNIQISVDTTNIGGPSAGLAFTLALIDELTPGELTGNQKVAVTGTIDVAGQVGPIGGLPSKAAAVKQIGAKYFLVPASQSKEDIAKAQKVLGPGVQIITVSTLDEALAALASIGGQAPTLQPLTPDTTP